MPATRTTFTSPSSSMLCTSSPLTASADHEIDRFESLLMAPGQRADVLVQAGAAGTYALRAIANDQGYPSPVGPLAQLIVEGEPLPMPLPATLGAGAACRPSATRRSPTSGA